MKKSPEQQQPMSTSTKIWISIFILISLLFISTITAAVLVGNNNVDANTAHIKVHGVITGDGSSGIFSSNSASSTEIVRELKKAKNDEQIKAVLLEINSPGGSPVASDEIAQAIKDVRAANKTVVALIREEGASGGYWIASATNHIVANRMSVTGSIGVIGSYMQFDKFLADWNVSYNRMVAGERKDIGDPFVNLDDTKKEFLQRKLDKLHTFFIEEVATNRNMSVKDVRDLADGEIYLGVEAKEVGLVDELGGQTEALNYIKKKIGVEPSLVVYEPDKTFMEELFGVVSPAKQPTLEDVARQQTVGSDSPQFQMR